MITRVSNLAELTVHDIMVPRTDVTSIPYNASIEKVIEIIKADGHSRFPVWNKSVDDIMGILYVKDLFPLFSQSQPEFKLRHFLRRAHFIPESKKVLELLGELQIKQNHLAIVVDEYGGFSGIVALEDILEEIVGEIMDEYDKEEEAPITQLTSNTYILDSRTNIEELNEALHIQLEAETADTIGGFVFNLFGHIPEENESITFEDIHFKVLKLEGNRIVRIQMTIGTDTTTDAPHETPQAPTLNKTDYQTLQKEITEKAQQIQQALLGQTTYSKDMDKIVKDMLPSLPKLKKYAFLELDPETQKSFMEMHTRLSQLSPMPKRIQDYINRMNKALGL